MAGEVLNIKVCSPLKQRSGLTGKYHEICTTHTIFVGQFKNQPTDINLFNLNFNFLRKKLKKYLRSQMISCIFVVK